jgi:hypothetical protein
VLQLAIGWYRLQDHRVTGTRKQVAEIAEICKMPVIRPHNTSVQAFKQAAYAPAIIHNNAGTRLATRSVEILGSPAGVKVIELQAEGKPVRRLAQLKHFSARRTASGAVKSSERVMSRISGRMDASEAEGVRVWVDRFEQACGNGQVGAAMVRAYVGREWDGFAIPVPDRKGTYYFYAGDAERVQRINTFVATIAAGSYAMALPLANNCPREPMIEAIENYFTTAFAALENRAVSAGTLRNRSSAWKRLSSQLDMHEEKLGAALPRAYAAAASARRLISPAQDPKTLPTVDLQ